MRIYEYNKSAGKQVENHASRRKLFGYCFFLSNQQDGRIHGLHTGLDTVDALPCRRPDKGRLGAVRLQEADGGRLLLQIQRQCLQGIEADVKECRQQSSVGKVAWVQIGDNYFRASRRNIDGYRMYHHPEKLEDLFDVKEVFDPARPTPVPDSGPGM